MNEQFVESQLMNHYILYVYKTLFRT